MSIVIRSRLLCVIILIGLSRSANAAETTFSVREAGAAADGKTLCTAALQRAIDRCAEAGGGTVHFPAGTYLSGTLVLKSHVTLHLEAGATLLGSPDPKHYPPYRPAVRSYTDNYVSQALLVGENLEQVSLRGAGTIDGNGASFRWKEYRDRPYVIRLVNCRDVVVEGLSLRNSPMWMQHYLACDRVRLQGLRVFNHVSYNNDGVDLDGCHDVTVSDCVIDSDDDGLCLKSTLDRACENVTVTNCVLSSHANAFKLGTESNGGFKNITLSNCVILSPRFSQSIYGVQRGVSGVALETVDGGRLENIVVTNLTISGVNVPIFLRLGNRARPFVANGAKPGRGSFQNVIISNIVATGAGRVGCSITGLPGQPVENVTLTNLSLEFEGGGPKEWSDRPVPERADAYPESRMFGDLPGYALYCRHVQGLKVSGLRVSVRTADLRHAIVCDDVRDLELSGLSLPAGRGVAALIRLSQVGDAMIHGCRARDAADVFLKVDGDSTRRVVLFENELANVQRPVEAGSSVPADGVRLAGAVLQK